MPKLSVQTLCYADRLPSRQLGALVCEAEDAHVTSLWYKPLSQQLGCHRWFLEELCVSWVAALEKMPGCCAWASLCLRPVLTAHHFCQHYFTLSPKSRPVGCGTRVVKVSFL